MRDRLQPSMTKTTANVVCSTPDINPKSSTKMSKFSNFFPQFFKSKGNKQQHDATTITRKHVATEDNQKEELNNSDNKENEDKNIINNNKSTDKANENPDEDIKKEDCFIKIRESNISDDENEVEQQETVEEENTTAREPEREEEKTEKCDTKDVSEVERELKKLELSETGEIEKKFNKLAIGKDKDDREVILYTRAPMFNHEEHRHKSNFKPYAVSSHVLQSGGIVAETANDLSQVEYPSLINVNQQMMNLAPPEFPFLEQSSSPPPELLPFDETLLPSLDPVLPSVDQSSLVGTLAEAFPAIDRAALAEVVEGTLPNVDQQTLDRLELPDIDQETLDRLVPVDSYVLSPPQLNIPVEAPIPTTVSELEFRAPSSPIKNFHVANGQMQEFHVPNNRNQAPVLELQVPNNLIQFRQQRSRQLSISTPSPSSTSSESPVSSPAGSTSDSSNLSEPESVSTLRTGFGSTSLQDPRTSPGVVFDPLDESCMYMYSHNGTNICTIIQPQSPAVVINNNNNNNIYTMQQATATHTTQMSAPVPANRNRCVQQASLPPLIPGVDVPKTEPKSAKSRLALKLNKQAKETAMVTVAGVPNDKLAMADASGDTQLMILISNNHPYKLEYIYAMVNRLKDIPGALQVKNQEGQSALFMACMFYPEEPLVARFIAEALLEKGLAVNETYGQGNTLLHFLCARGDSHIGVLVELLSMKDSSGDPCFNVNQQNYKEGAPLHTAVKKHSKSVNCATTVAFLLQEGANGLDKERCSGQTALHMAVKESCDPQLIKIILQDAETKGSVLVNMKDYPGDMALHHAALRNDIPVKQQTSAIQLLMRYGAVSNHVGSQGRMPLALVSQERKSAIQHIIRKR